MDALNIYMDFGSAIVESDTVIAQFHNVVYPTNKGGGKDAEGMLGTLDVLKISNNSPSVGSLGRDELIKIQKFFYEQYKEFYLTQCGYEGKYIALLGGAVIDSDADFSEMAARIYALYPAEAAIYMPFVSREDEIGEVATPFEA